jgi:hypothetical protein
MEQDVAMTALARARRDEAVTLQCSTDGRLSAADYCRLTELSRAG